MTSTPPKTDLIRRHLEFLRFYPKSVEANYNLGLAYLEAGELDDALQAFHHALELRPTLAEAYINMGGIFFRQGKLEECIRANEKAVELAPDSVQAHNNLAFALLRTESWERSMEASRRVLELNPGAAMAYHHLAVALHGLGRDDEAIAHLDEAVKLGFRADPAFRKELQPRAKKRRPRVVKNG